MTAQGYTDRDRFMGCKVCHYSQTKYKPIVISDNEYLKHLCNEHSKTDLINYIINESEVYDKEVLE